jgi:cobalamin biosynthesis Mg chelatase CobN
MNRLLLALLVCAACKHSTSSSSTSHSETSTVTDTQTSESGATTTTTTVTEQPGETTTTTEEFGPPEPPNRGTPDALEPSPAPLPHGVNGGTPKLPRHGPLVKRTVTVTKSGGETTQSRTEATQQATGATETRAQATGDTKAQAQSASAPAASCVSLGWLWGLVILAVVFVAWRLLRKV